MSIGFPLGFLALLGLAPLVAAYFLRRRQHPRVVSALFLWKTPDLRAQAGPRFERFSRELSLFLESAALVTAALFLADVHCGKSAEKAHTVVVVDGSLSMNAVSDGASVADRARDAIALIAREEGAAVLTVVESGAKPRVLAGPQLATDRALTMLRAWRPMQPDHEVLPALLLARELATSKDQRLHFFTDGPLPEGVVVPPSVQVRSLGVPLDNVAIVAAQRRDERGAATVNLRVANFSNAAVRVPVRFREQREDREEIVELAAQGSSALRLTLSTEQPIEVSLPDDALKEDGQVKLLFSPQREVGLELRAGLDAAAVQALTRFAKVAPAVKLGSPNAELTVGPAGSTASVTLGAQGKLRSFVGPFFAQKDHALLEDVQLSGVVWTAGENPPGRPLLSAGSAVLMAEEENGSVHLNVELSRSDLQRTVAWPVLLNNLVQRARSGSVGFPRRHLALGEEVQVVTEAGSTFSLVSEAGTKRVVMASGRLSLPALTEAGRWALERDGKEVDSLEVLPLDARESDLSSRGPYRVDAAAPSALASLASLRPRPVWLVLVLLAWVLLDFWLTSRRGVSR